MDVPHGQIMVCRYPTPPVDLRALKEAYVILWRARNGGGRHPAFWQTTGPYDSNFSLQEEHSIIHPWVREGYALETVPCDAS